jgi:hypothetical protein
VIAKPARPFFWIACLATLCGSVVGLTRLPWGFDPEEDHPGWLHRYEAVSAPLGSASAALFVSDDQGGTAKYKLFRAQFALAPVVVLDRNRLEVVSIRHLLNRPLIFDGSSPRSVDKAVADLSRRAGEMGLAIEVERLPRSLAVVRARSVR